MAEAGRGQLVKMMEGHCQRGRRTYNSKAATAQGSAMVAGTLSTLFPGHLARKSGSSNLGRHYRSRQLYLPNEEPVKHLSQHEGDGAMKVGKVPSWPYSGSHRCWKEN